MLFVGVDINREREFMVCVVGVLIKPINSFNNEIIKHKAKFPDFI